METTLEIFKQLLLISGMLQQINGNYIEDELDVDEIIDRLDNCLEAYEKIILNLEEKLNA